MQAEDEARLTFAAIAQLCYSIARLYHNHTVQCSPWLLVHGAVCCSGGHPCQLLVTRSLPPLKLYIPEAARLS